MFSPARSLIAPFHLSFLAAVRAKLNAFSQRRRHLREAQALAYLDRRLLRDIGISQLEARREIARLGWKAPDHWRD